MRRPDNAVSGGSRSGYPLWSEFLSERFRIYCEQGVSPLFYTCEQRTVLMASEPFYYSSLCTNILHTSAVLEQSSPLPRFDLLRN